jgi:hypothetical protein
LCPLVIRSRRGEPAVTLANESKKRQRRSWRARARAAAKTAWLRAKPIRTIAVASVFAHYVAL